MINTLLQSALVIGWFFVLLEVFFGGMGLFCFVFGNYFDWVEMKSHSSFNLLCIDD